MRIAESELCYDAVDGHRLAAVVHACNGVMRTQARAGGSGSDPQGA
jgi:hypothetical protein